MIRSDHLITLSPNEVILVIWVKSGLLRKVITQDFRVERIIKEDRQHNYRTIVII